jgi:hypothetical protein
MRCIPLGSALLAALLVAAWAGSAPEAASAVRPPISEGQTRSLTLTITGACGGQMTARVDGGTPNGSAALVYCFGPGGPTVIPPGFSCPGVILDLNKNARLGAVLALDAAGSGTLIPVHVPSGACGIVRVQALDLTTCAASNVVTL